MKITFGAHSLEVTPAGVEYLAAVNGAARRVQVVRADAHTGRMELLIDGRRVVAHVSMDGAKRWVTLDGSTRMLTKTSGAKRGARHDYAGGLIAPMPGQVRSVAARVGDSVVKGQTLLTMEAMKMEIRIQALNDGKVTALHVQPGQTVEREQILIEVEDAA
ncbi:MAG: hypothetical protein Fur002_24580 [Anaerolineales bacterium]